MENRELAFCEICFRAPFVAYRVPARLPAVEGGQDVQGRAASGRSGERAVSCCSSPQINAV